jgi:hypothetical protein
MTTGEPPMTTLIKDLIDIPEHVQRGDFVLRLSEGWTVLKRRSVTMS